MAGHGWGTAGPVNRWLFEEGHRFGFFQAVRLLEQIYPNATPLGEGVDARQEPVRLRAANSFAFPASEIAEVKDPADPEMTVNFLGLGGALGPLPLPYSERVLRRTQAGDDGPRDFLDIFNHRLLSLVYRVRRKHRIGLEWRSPEEQGFASYLYALMGLGTGGLQGRLKIPDRALLRYAGLLSRYPRSTSVLVALLQDFFGVRVRDQQFLGAFRPFDEDQWTAIGMTGRNQRLGQDAVLGTRVWDQHAGIGLTLGPMGWAQYQDLLPGRAGFRALCQLVRFYIGPTFDLSIHLRLPTTEIQPTRLSSTLAAARLGWTSWLGPSAGPDTDPEETEVTVHVADVQRFRDEPLGLERALSAEEGYGEPETFAEPLGAGQGAGARQARGGEPLESIAEVEPEEAEAADLADLPELGDDHFDWEEVLGEEDPEGGPEKGQ